MKAEVDAEALEKVNDSAAGLWKEGVVVTGDEERGAHGVPAIVPPGRDQRAGQCDESGRDKVSEWEGKHEGVQD